MEPIQVGKYKSHQTVLAVPLKRGAYCEYRGWGLLTDEDPDTDGYLIEILNNSNSNHENHDGYISWLCAEEFESGFSLITD